MRELRRRFAVSPSPAPAVAGAGTLLLALSLVGQAAPTKPGVIRQQTQASPVSYNRDVRPILAENCFACHGPDSAARKAGLRLDKFADAVAFRDGQRRAITPGDPVNSEVARRILASEDDPLAMPPVQGHKRLTAQQRRILLLWIEQGAKYEAHWSLIPPKRPALPAVKNAAWCRNPLDRFVLARLEKAGLSPAPEADKRTLARRVSFDLTGLPPDPAEVARFLADTSSNAYENYVDRLLASPAWGEHRGRYWLDAARYADTNGIHFDNYREMWSYRDWVISAFNHNMPFDEFTVEQLAGDLLPNPTLAQRTATGFNRCNITTNEGGAIDEEYRVLYTRDRTETAGQVFLGATVGCAVCHDHKFDPISQREFYSLAAFFNNTIQNAMDGNVKDTPPVVSIPRPEDTTRWAMLPNDLTAARQAVETRKTAAHPDFSRWITNGGEKNGADFAVPSDSLRFHALLAEGQGNDLSVVRDGQTAHLTAAAMPKWDTGQTGEKSFVRTPGAEIADAQTGDFDKNAAFSYAAWVKIMPNAGGSIMARMDDQHDFRGWDMWLEGGRPAAHFINKWPENALKVTSRDGLMAGKWQHVCVTYAGSGTPDGVKIYIDGVSRPLDVPANALKDTIRTTVPFKIGQRHSTSGVDGTAIQDVRVYGRVLNPNEVANLAHNTRAAYLAGKGASRTEDEQNEMFAWWLGTKDTPYNDLTSRVAALQNEEKTIRERGTIAQVSQEKNEAAMAFILTRGEYDRRGEKVSPQVPAALPALPKGFPQNRLGFARWLLLPEHPLTARVTVNRFWQEVFGQGLVRTSGDFGVMGELPSHPELLDYLAVEFRQPVHGGKSWDIKRLFKMMVTSAAYRQAAVATPQKRRLDPTNRLLSRGPRFRMDAEMVRDTALAASGLLVHKIGGPSVRPYQPAGVWEAVAMPESNTRNYKQDTGEGLYRRSLYTFWKRAAPPASLDVFNAPNRETCTVRRERTNTPLQALVTLNDVQYVEAARVLAEHALTSSAKTDDARFDYIAQRLVARPLAPREKVIIAQSLTELLRYYRAHEPNAQTLLAFGDSKPDKTLPAPTLAAWTMLANELLNLDEVLNK